MDTPNSSQTSGMPPKVAAIIVEPRDPKDVEVNKEIAAISYVWILSVVVFFTRRDSAFVRFHARQGLTLFIISIVCYFVPVAGRFLMLAVLALDVLGFLAAAQGQWKELPVIGPLSQGDWHMAVEHLKHWLKQCKRFFAAAMTLVPKRKEKPAPTPPPAQPHTEPVPSTPAPTPAAPVTPPPTPPVA